MRYFSFLLIVLNVAFYLWAHHRPQAEVPRHAGMSDDVASLALVGERELRQRQAAREIAAANVALVPAVSEAVGGIPAEASRVQDPNPLPETALGTDAGDDVPAPAEGTEAAPETVAMAGNAQAVGDMPGANPAPRDVALCLTLGPVDGEPDADAVEQALEGIAGIRYSRRAQAGREQQTYLVFLPAMPGGVAVDITRSLRERGFDDYFIGPGNFISLGLFSSEAAARKRMDRIREMGHEALLETRSLHNESYAYDITILDGETGKPGAAVTALLATLPAVEHRFRACSQIASGTPNP